MKGMEPMKHVVMIVGNDITVDTRVKKIALSVAKAGLQVTVIGLSTSEKRERSQMGPVQIIRVPVPLTYRDWTRKSGGRRSLKDPASVKGRLKIVSTKKKLRQRELAASLGRLPQGSSGSPVVRVRREAIRWANRFVGKAYGLRERMLRRRFNKMAVQVDKKRRFSVPSLSRTQWRSKFPELHDYELAFGPVIDELLPDVIHAHDVHMIGIAERAVARARVTRKNVPGRDIKWIYDAHEYVPGLARYTRDVVKGYSKLEDEYINNADAIITVSEPLADLLVKDHGLSTRPAVVLNIPIETIGPDRGVSVRTAAGVEDDVPLIVYSGGIDPARGVQTLVSALEHLPEVHVAIVASPRNMGSAYVLSLIQQARDRGYEDRVHVVPFVAPDAVVEYLRSAQLGVHPLSTGVMNHQIALPNKLFEYLHAGLPIVISDNRAMAEFVNQTKVGEVFADEDPVKLASAIRLVLEDHAKYIQAIVTSNVLNDYNWDRQVEVLVDLYRDILPDTEIGTEPIVVGDLSEGERFTESGILVVADAPSTLVSVHGTLLDKPGRGRVPWNENGQTT